MTVPREPMGPGDSYFEVAEALGDAYFSRPTPDVGVLLSVAGSDGAVTRWHITEDLAKGLSLYVWNHPRLAEVGRCVYDHRASMS